MAFKIHKKKQFPKLTILYEKVGKGVNYQSSNNRRVIQIFGALIFLFGMIGGFIVSLTGPPAFLDDFQQQQKIGRKNRRSNFFCIRGSFGYFDLTATQDGKDATLLKNTIPLK